MKNKLYIMCGVPGSGKSTFAKLYFPEALYISRDEIRFALVKEDEEYFSKEDEVYNLFINKIKNGLNEGKNVIADATHLNQYSRLKLVKSLGINPKDTEIVIIFMNVPLKECIARNEKRKGTRSYVPIPAIIRMSKNLRTPTFDECFGMIHRIITVDETEHIISLKKEEF